MFESISFALFPLRKTLFTDIYSFSKSKFQRRALTAVSIQRSNSDIYGVKSVFTRLKDVFLRWEYGRKLPHCSKTGNSHCSIRGFRMDTNYLPVRARSKPMLTDSESGKRYEKNPQRHTLTGFCQLFHCNSPAPGPNQNACPILTWN